MAAEDVRPNAELEYTDVNAEPGSTDLDAQVEDGTEVVAHAEDGEDLPWCVGYLC